MSPQPFDSAQDLREACATLLLWALGLHRRSFSVGVRSPATKSPYQGAFHSFAILMESSSPPRINRKSLATLKKR